MSGRAFPGSSNQGVGPSLVGSGVSGGVGAEVLGEPAVVPDVSAAEVTCDADIELADLRFAREGSDTGAVALKAMGLGAIAVVRDLHARGRCAGAIGPEWEWRLGGRLGRPPNPTRGARITYSRRRLGGSVAPGHGPPGTRR